MIHYDSNVILQLFQMSKQHYCITMAVSFKPRVKIHAFVQLTRQFHLLTKITIATIQIYKGIVKTVYAEIKVDYYSVRTCWNLFPTVFVRFIYHKTIYLL